MKHKSIQKCETHTPRHTPVSASSPTTRTGPNLVVVLSTLESSHVADMDIMFVPGSDRAAIDDRHLGASWPRRKFLGK